MKMGIRFLGMGLLCTLAACGPSLKKDAPAAPNAGQSSASASPTAATENIEFNIGDAEAAVKLIANVAPASKSLSVATEELVDAKSDLNMVTATVKPPAPTQFSITVTLKSKNNFTEAPVVLRAKILRDKDVIDSFEAFLGENARTQPFERTVDVLAGLAAVPDTLLVRAEAELILLPPGTAPSSVDLRMVKGSDEKTGAAISNPVRINFEKGTATP